MWMYVCVFSDIVVEKHLLQCEQEYGRSPEMEKQHLGMAKTQISSFSIYLVFSYH